MKFFSLFIVLVLFFSLAVAHPGRTDSKGGHYNRKTGEYHYHNKDSSSKASDNVKTVSDSNSKANEKPQVDANSTTLEKMQLEIKSLRANNAKQEQMIDRFKRMCQMLRKQNVAMKQLLTDANIPLPKVTLITDTNDPIEEPNTLESPASAKK
jgi:hypothetical protein